MCVEKIKVSRIPRVCDPCPSWDRRETGQGEERSERERVDVYLSHSKAAKDPQVGYGFGVLGFLFISALSVDSKLKQPEMDTHLRGPSRII